MPVMFLSCTPAELTNTFVFAYSLQPKLLQPWRPFETPVSSLKRTLSFPRSEGNV